MAVSVKVPYKTASSNLKIVEASSSEHCYNVPTHTVTFLKSVVFDLQELCRNEFRL